MNNVEIGNSTDQRSPVKEQDVTPSKKKWSIWKIIVFIVGIFVASLLILGIIVSYSFVNLFTQLKTTEFRGNYYTAESILKLSDPNEFCTRGPHEGFDDRTVIQKNNACALHVRTSAKSFPIDLSEYPNLKEMTISGSVKDKVSTGASNPLQLHEIPKDIKELPNLLSLEIRNGNIRSVPAEIGMLKNLKLLTLLGLNLETLPIEIGDINKVTHIDLSYNKLSDLPESFGRLDNLERVNLHDNLFSEIPPELLLLKNLKHISLTKNPIKSVPITLNLVPKLESVYLSSNNLTKEEIDEILKIIDPRIKVYFSYSN